MDGANYWDSLRGHQEAGGDSLEIRIGGLPYPEAVIDPDGELEEPDDFSKSRTNF